MKATIDHTEIRDWIESHNARPAIIDHPGAQGDRRGLRVDFPGDFDEVLLGESVTKDTDWDEFFRIFDEQKLQFAYDINPESKDPTTWYRFEYRER